VRLDGLPLALELAAAHLRLFPPQALLARLDSRLSLLTGGARDLPERQQALRTTLDWSHSLLTPAEQQLFARFAVFVSGSTLEAIATICDAEGTLDVLAVVEALVRQSLLQQTATAGEVRLVMLETIHEYAWAQLQAEG
jgi:predicted ATPase